MGVSKIAFADHLVASYDVDDCWLLTAHCMYCVDK